MADYADPNEALIAEQIARANPNAARSLFTNVSSIAPGAGALDAMGYYPNAEGGYAPSLVENLRQGNYGTAGLQSLGAMGDMMLMSGMLAPVGMALKGIATTGKAAKVFGEAPKLLPQNVGKDVKEVFNITEEGKKAWSQGRPKFTRFKDEKIEAANRANAQELFDGKITQEEFRKRNLELMPYSPYKEVPELTSVEDIAYAIDKGKAKKGIIGVTTEIPEGTLVGARLDIPSYEQTGTWVNTVHAATSPTDVSSSPIGYGQTAVLKNVNFSTKPADALDIARSKEEVSNKLKGNKATIARMVGNWVSHSPEKTHELAKKLMNDPDWIQVGMNPDRASFFYDKADGMPLTEAEEVIQIGALVLAKKAKKTTPDDPRFTVFNKKTGQPIKDPMGKNVTYAALPIGTAAMYDEEDNPLRNELLKD